MSWHDHALLIWCCMSSGDSAQQMDAVVAAAQVDEKFQQAALLGIDVLLTSGEALERICF